jgi:hypothetical protein
MSTSLQLEAAARGGGQLDPPPDAATVRYAAKEPSRRYVPSSANSSVQTLVIGSVPDVFDAV